MKSIWYNSGSGKVSSGNSDFFRGGKKSPWYIVAVSTIGSSISGVTYLSVPGMVAASSFSYMQMVLGFTLGYVAVAYLLLPLYYRMDMNSIYGYLEQRFGREAYFTGSGFFFISKLLGCGVRMFLTANVLQFILFDRLGIPFWLNVAVTVVIVWLYTVRGGVRTLVWVDMVQTLAMVGAVVLCICQVAGAMGLDFRETLGSISGSRMSEIWVFDDFRKPDYFWKQFLAGVFTTVTMTGLDQDMMQKNLSCRNLKEAQKNMITSGFLYLPLNLVFLGLGVLLYQFCELKGIDTAVPDQVFASVATGPYMPAAVAAIFLIGLITAGFSSSGSAITALTTSFTVDFLRADRRASRGGGVQAAGDGGEAPAGSSGERAAGNGGEAAERRLAVTRVIVHTAMAILVGAVVYSFKVIGNRSVIDAVYTIASYTYGPLLGLYAFGMATKRHPRGLAIPSVCLLSPLVCLLLNKFGPDLFGGYRFGFEMLLINGAICFVGLLIASSGKYGREGSVAGK